MAANIERRVVVCVALALVLGGCVVDPASQVDAFDSNAQGSAGEASAGESGDSDDDDSAPDPDDDDDDGDDDPSDADDGDPSGSDPSGSDPTDPDPTDPEPTDPDPDPTDPDPTDAESDSGPTEPICGDGVVDPGEACDCGNGQCGAAQLDQNACEDLAAPGGGNFDGGTLGCTAACELDDSECFDCGDGIVDGGEECDGDNNGAECSDAGYLGGGTVACANDCTFDTSDCNGPICGIADAGIGGCPAECSSCEAGVCVFDCPGNIIDGGPCNGLALECPPGWPCDLRCGDAGCVDTSFTCSDGVCTIECEGIQACEGTTVECGIQSCIATCDVFTEPALGCGESCDCVAC